MQLENIATPQEDSTPELRYASLHRSVERGMASDEVLSELVDICLQLGHVDEAVRVHAGMKPGPTRDHVGSKLARRGLIARSAEAKVAAEIEFDDGDPSIAEHVLDSIQFLCQAHMPAVALLTMLAFPLIVGVGGFLTAGGSLWLFAGLATLPGLCVLGVVGAMGRQIFLHSVEGEEEIPAIPAPAEMLQAAKRYLGDVLIVLGILVAPSLTLLWFEAPLVSSLPGLLLGMFLVPIALILRQIRGDIGALSPVALVRGIGCCRGYVKVTLAFWGAFSPAAIAFWSSLGHAVWLQIAIVGPLAVLPTFAAARLLGTFTEAHRSRLGLLLYPQNSRGAKATASATTATAGTARPAASKPAARPSWRKPLLGKRTERPQHTPLAPRATAPAPARPQQSPTLGARPGLPPLGNTRRLVTDAFKADAAKVDAPKAAAPSQPSNLPPRPKKLEHKAAESTPQPSGFSRRPQPEDWMAEPKKHAAPAAHIEGRAPKAPAAPARPAARPASANPAPAKATPAKAAQAKATPAKPAPKSAARSQPAANAPAAPTAELGGPDLSNIPGATIITGDDRERFGAASRKQ